jgi:hypothetical protein
LIRTPLFSGIFVVVFTCPNTLALLVVVGSKVVDGGMKTWTNVSLINVPESSLYSSTYAVVVVEQG